MMTNGSNDRKVSLAPNSRPYLLKRIISDVFDTVLIFLLFILFSALLFASPLADAYNGHYENILKETEKITSEYGKGTKEASEALRNDAYYSDELFAANLHSFILKAAAGLMAECIVLLAVPLVSRTRGTPGKIMTGLIPFSEKKQTRASRPVIAGRFIYIFIIDSLFLYLFTGIATFILVPVIRLIEMLLNSKNKTLCDAVTGIMIIEKLSYNGIEQISEDLT